MKNLLSLFGLFCTVTVFAQNPASVTTLATTTNAAPASMPGDASLAYMQAAQQGTVAVDGAPGGGRYFPPVPANPKLPTLWLIGDSTVRNGTPGNGSTNAPDGQWGWGAPITYYFDIKKVNVVNRAYGGTTALSFYTGFFWKNLQPQIKPGDFVIMQFGANSGELPGSGDETQETTDRSGQPSTRHTFGWYLKQMVKETREKGATCIVCSLTPRKTWVGDKLDEKNTHVAWTEQAAKDTNAPYIDLHELIQHKYTEAGREKVDSYYVPTPSEAAALPTPTRAEGLHTGWAGAVVNAECVVSGLKSLKDNPLAAMLSTRGKAIKPAPADCVADNLASAKPADATAK